MAFSPSVFKTNLVGEGARPTLFEARIFFDGLTENNFTFKCKAAQLPGVTTGLIEVPYFGRKVKVAGDKTFAEWTVTIINDESFAARKAFETWQSGINQHNSNLRTNSDYMADAEVIQYAKTGEEINKYKFKGMWISDLAPIDVSWESNDALEEYSVTMQYQWWESVGTTDAA
jgi:hypothetical protein